MRPSSNHHGRPPRRSATCRPLGRGGARVRQPPAASQGWRSRSTAESRGPRRVARPRPRNGCRAHCRERRRKGLANGSRSRPASGPLHMEVEDAVRRVLGDDGVEVVAVPGGAVALAVTARCRRRSWGGSFLDFWRYIQPVSTYSWHVIASVRAVKDPGRLRRPLHLPSRPLGLGSRPRGARVGRPGVPRGRGIDDSMEGRRLRACGGDARLCRSTQRPGRSDVGHDGDRRARRQLLVRRGRPLERQQPQHLRHQGRDRPRRTLHARHLLQLRRPPRVRQLLRQRLPPRRCRADQERPDLGEREASTSPVPAHRRRTSGAPPRAVRRSRARRHRRTSCCRSRSRRTSSWCCSTSRRTTSGSPTT